jgi:dihydroflavonol-4-reductase
VKVFVTGATGFIGSTLVRELLALGHDIRCLVRKGSDRRNIDGLDVEVVNGDLRDTQTDLQFQMKGFEAVFHLAAVYSVWTTDEAAVFDSNVQGTQHVLYSAARAGVRKVVYTSSESTIGVPRGGQGNEDNTTEEARLRGAYTRSKHQAEVIAVDFWRSQKLPVVVVNPTMPIGERDIKPTPTGQMIVDYLNRRMPAGVEAGMNIVDVRDVAIGHLLAMEHGKPGERYILGSRNVTFRKMLEILETTTGVKAPRVNLPAWMAPGAAWADEMLEGRLLRRRPMVQGAALNAAAGYRYHDCSKAIRELHMPQSPVEPAFSRAADWFRKNGYVHAG